MPSRLLYFDYFKIKLYIENYIKIIFILFEYFILRLNIELNFML